MADKDTSLSIGESVYKKLYNDIILLKYEPGSTLIEKEIAAEMNTSSSPVKDAIDKLIDQGLVVRQPGRKSPTVAEIKYSDCMQLLEIRESLEAHAAYYAAKRIREDELKELKKHLEALRIDSETTPEKLARADAAFHKQIFLATHNSYFINAFARIYPNVLRYLLYVLKDLDISKLRQYERHLPIYNAIASRSGILARDEVLDTAEYMFIVMHLGIR